MHVHGSCAARRDAAVLIIGASGTGKSDLVLRLLGRGFVLVADDQVIIENGRARPPLALAGLLEIRGLGIIRLAHAEDIPVRLVVRTAEAAATARLPLPSRHDVLDVPMIAIDPGAVSAAERIGLALDCALGEASQLAGAFAT